jgi:hydrogenase nickel incorporation protein HypA/HybF
MHELAVTQSVLEIALRHARQRNARRITDLHLVLGQWSSIVDDSVQFYWDIISEGTIAQGATLHFRRVPVELACLDCGQVYQPTGEELICPHCASARVRVRQGDELQLEAIDIE